MINGDRIRQARELAGLTQAELAENIGTTQPIIAQYESGRLSPPEEILVALGESLGFPITFFSREDPPEFPLGSLLFRSHVAIAAAEKGKAYRLGQLEFEITSHLVKRVRSKIALRLPQLDDEPADHVMAAQLTRNALGLGLDMPIAHLVKALEQSGIIVLSIPTRFKTCDSYSCWANVPSSDSSYLVRKPLIIIAGEASGDRMRFSLAHELGHLVLHQAVKETREMEDEANKFAAEFLLPEGMMRSEFIRPVTLASITHLKPIWGVSLQALIHRASELNIISKSQNSYLQRQITSRGWKLVEPMTIPAEKPRALRQMVEILYGTPINYQRFARDFDLQPLYAKQLLDAYASREEYAIRSIKKPEEVHELIQKSSWEQKPEETSEDSGAGGHPIRKLN